MPHLTSLDIYLIPVNKGNLLAIYVMNTAQLDGDLRKYSRRRTSKNVAMHRNQCVLTFINSPQKIGTIKISVNHSSNNLRYHAKVNANM